MKHWSLLSLLIVVLGCGVFIIRSSILLSLLSLLFIALGFILSLIGWSLIIWLTEMNANYGIDITYNTGLPGILNYVENKIISLPSYNPTGVESLDHVIEHLILLILRDFILNWHDNYFHDKVFPELVLTNLHLIVEQLSTRIQAVSWTKLCALQINAIITLHVKIFIKSIKILDEKDYIHENHTKIINEFFNIETNMSNINSHRYICTDYNKEIEYITFLVESLMFYLLPDVHFNEKILRYFVRDVLVTRVILPMINTICDPDYVNQIIHSNKNDFNFTNEFFNCAIRITNSSFDLKELSDAIQAEITRLSMYDMDEKELEEITKKQISSLMFIQRLCKSQAENSSQRKGAIKTSPTVCNQMNVNVCDLSAASIKLEDIPFRELVENKDYSPILVDYFQQTGEELAFFLYVGVKDLLEKYDNLLSSESYLKNTISQNNPQIANLRKEVISLVNTYDKQISARNVKFEYKKHFDAILAEISEHIPSVKTLRNLPDAILTFYKDPRYLDPFYSSQKYSKLFENIRPCPIQRKSQVVFMDAFHFMLELFNRDFTLDINIPEAVLCNQYGNPYYMYVIDIVFIVNNIQYSWKILRRFRSFVEFHDNLINKFPYLSSLTFPEKRILGNKLIENVGKRRKILDVFLKNLINHEHFRKQNNFYETVISFIDGKSCYISDRQSEITRFSDIPSGDTIDSQDSIIKNELDFALCRKNTINLDNEDVESLAMSLLVTLIEELFDIRTKTPWITRQIKTFVKEFIIMTMRDKVIRKILDSLECYFNADAVTMYLSRLQQTFWPNNTWSGPSPHRSNETKARERIIASTILIGSLPTELRRFLGEDVSLDGIQKLFNLLQIQTLNKRLFYTILENVIESLFPDNSYGHIFKSMLETTSNK